MLKSLLQSYRTGELTLTNVPMPNPRGQVLVRTYASLVSIGTERTMIDTAQKSLLGKALARPDLVRQVIAKAQVEHLKCYRQASL